MGIGSREIEVEASLAGSRLLPIWVERAVKIAAEFF
jgi:hypothetical protein